MYYQEGEPYGGRNVPPSTPYVEKSPGRTRQDDLKASNINNIVKRYQRTGELPVKNREAFFADVSAVPDFQTAMNIVDQAREGFMSLPAEVRAKHDNDPAKFVDWTADPANRDEMVKMGLLDAPNEITADAAIAGDLARKAAESSAVESVAEGGEASSG